jgi:hypothetical protein
VRPLEIVQVKNGICFVENPFSTLRDYLKTIPVIEKKPDLLLNLFKQGIAGIYYSQHNKNTNDQTL